MAYEEVVETLQEVGQIHLSKSSVWRLSQRWGKRLKDQADTAASCRSHKRRADGAHERIIGWGDGICVDRRLERIEGGHDQ